MDTPALAPAPPVSAGPPAATAVAAAVTTAATTHLTYPDSVESSPRSRNTDSWDEPTLPPVPGAKLRLMCSYGGHIFPRPHDKSLCYLGGDTRIVVVDRHTSLADLSLRLSRSVLNGRPFTLKYQLPNEDLDSLITVTTDEDLENMIEEYDRTTSGSLLKPSRLRLFLFPTKVETASSIGTLIEDSKSDNWFVEALNGAGYLPRGASADAASVNCLLGLDDNVGVGVGSGGSGGGAQVIDGDVVGGGVQSDCSSLGNIVKQVKGNSQDVHSMPDSPMLETSSSFGSSSSSPSMVNLPPIRVHVEDHKMGLEDSFAQMGVSAVAALPPPLPTTIVSAATTNTAVSNVFTNEIPNRIVSDDERSEHGVPSTGYRKPPQPVSPQLQQKISDLPSPEENSRDNGVSNLISRAKPLIYQEQVQVAASPRDERVQVQVQGNSVVDAKRDIPDPNYRIQMQQVQDSSGYLMASQLDQQQQQQFQQQQQQQLQQQQQQQLQQQQQQQQQYVHAGTHYIHHTSGPVPISSYYPIHHPQQQHQQHQIDQHYPMYFVPIRQTQQPYNISMQSNLSDASSISSSRPPLPPNPTILTTTAYKEPVSSVYPARATTTPKPELAANVYRTATTATPQIVHMQGSDQHYANYSHQMHHPPQSIAAASNYSYEFTDPAHSQIYYTQPIASTLPPQYQTLSSAAVITGSDMSSQLPVEGIKQQQQQQQIRTSQPI